MSGHYAGDPAPYRAAGEAEAAQAERDPLVHAASRLLATGAITQRELAAEREAANDIVSEAIRFAQESPFPEPGHVLTDV